MERTLVVKGLNMHSGARHKQNISYTHILENAEAYLGPYLG